MKTEIGSVSSGSALDEQDSRRRSASSSAAPQGARQLVNALTDLANVFHEGRAKAATEGDEGYVQSVIDAAEVQIALHGGGQ